MTTRKPTSTKPKASNIHDLAAALEKAVQELSEVEGGAGKVRLIRAALEATAQKVATVAEGLDNTRKPSSVFDSSNPALVGRFIALAMIAQDRVPLSSIHRFYGAGVYAIYYKGAFPAYKAISSTEHPIYVGKADPAMANAKTVKEQGTKLWGRLNEHRKTIEKAKNLRIDEFECRFLVVASSSEKAAEDYLIELFQPVWNKEIRLVFGFGKHGDSPTTRANKRSPWDTMHWGRAWAKDSSADQKTVEQIEQQLAMHFANAKPYTSRESIFSGFMSEMRQLPTASSSTLT